MIAEERAAGTISTREEALELVERETIPGPREVSKVWPQIRFPDACELFRVGSQTGGGRGYLI